MVMVLQNAKNRGFLGGYPRNPSTIDNFHSPTPELKRIVDLAGLYISGWWSASGPIARLGLPQREHFSPLAHFHPTVTHAKHIKILPE